MERYYFQSTKDSSWKSKIGQRKKMPFHKNDLWLRFIRTFFVTCQVFDTVSSNL